MPNRGIFMKVIKESGENLFYLAAKPLIELVKTKPGCVLALSASAQLEGVYRALAQEGADFSRCTVFLTEEYVGAPEADTRLAKLRKMLPECAGFDARSICTIAADGDADAACAEYHAGIDAAHGIDMAVLAIGSDGHIAFDEPLAAFDSQTHPTRLIDSTRCEEFTGPGEAPAQGVTIGIYELMHARSVLLVATGEERAETVRKVVYDQPHISVPASLMQLHESVALYVDDAVAKLL